MAQRFHRTLRSLNGKDARTGVLLIAAGIALLVAWVLWFFLSSVAEYARSSQARIEVDGGLFRVDTPVAGVVASSKLVLGAEVSAGEVVVVLDSHEQEQRLVEERARLEALGLELEAMERQLAARRASMSIDGQATASLRGATGAARMRQREELRTSSMVPQVLIADLGREVAAAQGRRATAVATIASLTRQMELRQIRAPMGGRIADRATVTVGSYVEAGSSLGLILPSGRLHAVASFPDGVALGRIECGQRARVRLDGFPWAALGDVSATVSRVASESTAAGLRVELEFSPAPRIPLKHGLGGTVEIELARLSPASLVLRSLGREDLARLVKHREPIPVGRPRPCSDVRDEPWPTRPTGIAGIGS